MAAAPPPPRPRSPPMYPDLCGRRRLQLEVQILHREIGFLEEELQAIGGLQSVSRCCKEITEFVGTKPDPLVPLDKKRHRTCRVWKWIRKKLCCSFSWICCSSVCLPQLKSPSCSCSNSKNCCCHNCSCGFPSCSCLDTSNCTACCWPFSCFSSQCCEVSCCKLSCSNFSCCSCWPGCCKSSFWIPECCKLQCCKPGCCNISCSCLSCRRCTGDVCGCRKGLCCCVLPRISCPEYSCGCVWSCPKLPGCCDSCLCPKCSSKTCCISGCQC